MRANVCSAFALLASLLWLISAQAGGVNQLSPEEKAAGWKLLFDGRSTSGWRSYKQPTFPDGRWKVEEGWFHCLGKGAGEIITEAAYDNFELQWEWKQAVGGNSGVKYFISLTRGSPIGHEYQLIDEAREPDASQAEGKRVTAAFYDVLKPTTPPRPRAPGEINQSRIVVRGKQVEHWLNGEKVLVYECGSEALKAALARSKFHDKPGFGEKIKGHILLQDHRTEIWFRNVKIREF